QAPSCDTGGASTEHARNTWPPALANACARTRACPCIPDRGWRADFCRLRRRLDDEYWGYLEERLRSRRQKAAGSLREPNRRTGPRPWPPSCALRGAVVVRAMRSRSYEVGLRAVPRAKGAIMRTPAFVSFASAFGLALLSMVFACTQELAG